MRSNDDGDLDVDHELSVTGTVTGSVRVHSGGVLVLLGLASGGVVVAGGGFARISGVTNGLFVAAGGHLVLTGTCHGSATNDGGELVIEGAVTDAVITNTGITTIKRTRPTHPELGGVVAASLTGEGSNPARFPVRAPRSVDIISR